MRLVEPPVEVPPRRGLRGEVLEAGDLGAREGRARREARVQAGRVLVVVERRVGVAVSPLSVSETSVVVAAAVAAVVVLVVVLLVVSVTAPPGSSPPSLVV